MLFCYSILFFNLSWDIVVVVVTFGGHRSLVQVVMLLILRELLIKELYSFIPLAVKRFFFFKRSIMMMAMNPFILWLIFTPPESLSHPLDERNLKTIVHTLQLQEQNWCSFSPSHSLPHWPNDIPTNPHLFVDNL